MTQYTKLVSTTLKVIINVKWLINTAVLLAFYVEKQSDWFVKAGREEMQLVSCCEVMERELPEI